MSVLGHKLPRRLKLAASALPPKADTKAEGRRVRFGPILLQKSVAGFFGQ